MKITQEENELLKQLVNEYRIPPYDPEKHVTAKVLAEQANIDVRKAAYLLKQKYDDGILDRETVNVPGEKEQLGYYKKE